MSRKTTNTTRPLSLTEFRAMARSNFLYNLKSGMLSDLTKTIQEHEIVTRTGLERALNESEKSVKSIDLFLADQLKDNSSLEQELRTVNQMKGKMEKDLDLALKKMGDLKVDLFKTIESIRETMQCRDFLHSVSPQAWLGEYEALLEGHRAGRQSEMELLNEEFGNFITHMGDMDQEVENIVKEFVDIFQNAGPEVLPFREGKAIGGVLKKMEKTNAEMLVHIRDLLRPLEEGRRTLEEQRGFYRSEITEVTRTLNEILGDYTFLKERNARIESIIHTMTKSFKEQVASSEVLRNRALLESLYREVVQADQPKCEAVDIWKEIDEKFAVVFCNVGSFSKDEIERRRIAISRLNGKRLKEAEKARNRVLQMNQMVKGVRRSFWGPAVAGTRRPMRPRSEPPPPPPTSPPPPSPPGEDFTSELDYQSRLVQPLAASFHLPSDPQTSFDFPTARDSVSPERGDVADYLDRLNLDDEDEELEAARADTWEVPTLPPFDKPQPKSEESELQMN